MVDRREVEIRNELGLHARPSARFVEQANKFRSKISVRKEDQLVNGKSVMGLMTLAAAKGTRMIIEADGQDAGEAVEALARLIEEKFGEE